MKFKDLRTIVKIEFNNTQLYEKGKGNCMEVMWCRDCKRYNIKAFFSIYKSEIGNLTEEQVHQYLDVLKNKIGFEFDYEFIEGRWDLCLDYSKYPSARFGYLLFICLRYIYINNNACKAIITKTFELKEKTKFKWIKCLQLAHIWKQGNYENTIYLIGRLPIKLFELEELKIYITDAQTSLNVPMSSKNSFSDTNNLKKILEEFKNQVI